MVSRAVIRDDKLDEEAEKLSKTLKMPRGKIKMVLNAMIEERRNNKGQPKPPVPEGGISIRVAARKYNIPGSTIIGWIGNGEIEILERVPNWTYIKESDMIKKAKSYRPGRGRKKNNEN